jgi:hypothetical protein
MTLRKVLLTALVLAVVALPMTANATITRTIGMGGVGANYIIKDAYNTSIWPQLIRHYGKQAGAEFYSMDGWDMQKAYVIYDFGDGKSALMLALDKDESRDYGFLADTELSTLDAVPGGYNKLNVTYGRPMGEDMLVGAAISFAGKSYKTNEDGGNFDDSYSSFGLKLGLTAMEDKLDVGLGFSAGSYTVKHGGTTLAEADGASSIGLFGRYWYEASENYTIVPNIGIAAHTDNAKFGDAKSEYSESMVRLGLGNNWTPLDNFLSIAELGIMMVDETMKPDGGDEVSDSEADIYWRLGVESKIIFPWLKGRIGAERNWVGATTESMPGQPEWSSSMTMTYLGATVNWHRFQGDFLVNPSFIGYGPNFVSGYDDMIFTRASIKILFDKD